MEKEGKLFYIISWRVRFLNSGITGGIAKVFVKVTFKKKLSNTQAGLHEGQLPASFDRDGSWWLKSRI